MTRLLHRLALAAVSLSMLLPTILPAPATADNLDRFHHHQHRIHHRQVNRHEYRAHQSRHHMHVFLNRHAHRVASMKRHHRH